MPDLEAERAGPAWSESPKGTDTEGESALRTTSEMARTGLRVRDGHHSSSPCAGLLDLAWLAETHKVLRSAKDGRTRLCPEVLGNSKRTKADIGTTPVLQRGPLPLRRTDPKSGLLSDGSVSIPPAWVSASTENRRQVQNYRNVSCSQGEELVLRPKEKPARKPIQGAWQWTPLVIYVVYHRDIVPHTTNMLSILTITWHTLRRGRKWISARKTALSSR